MRSAPSSPDCLDQRNVASQLSRLASTVLSAFSGLYSVFTVSLLLRTLVPSLHELQN